MTVTEQAKTVERIQGVLAEIGDTSDLNEQVTREEVELNGQLQYQLSNGSWVDVTDSRVNEFLELCERQDKNGLGAVISSLNEGETIRNSSSDWYSNCRIKPQPVIQRQENRATITCRRCGQAGHAGNYPFSTLSSSRTCDDCL